MICSLSFSMSETFLYIAAAIEESIYNYVCRLAKWRREGIVSMSYNDAFHEGLSYKFCCNNDNHC